MRARFRSSVRVGVAVVLGLAWTQLALVLASVVVPPRVALAPRITHGAPYRLAEWTLLAPLSGASRIASAVGRPVTVIRPTCATAALCALLAMATCVGLGSLLGVERLRRLVRLAVLALCAVAVGSAGVVAGQLHDAVDAERTFFALVSHATAPSADEATVADARTFAEEYPMSRWRSEALRIVAMHASARGRPAEAERVWSQFEACFDDVSAPGVAFAEYSRALCFERLGQPMRALACYRTAIGVIRSRGDGVQGWIAPDAAKRIARLEQLTGMPVTAAYWKSQSQTLRDVCSIE